MKLLIKWKDVFEKLKVLCNHIGTEAASTAFSSLMFRISFLWLVMWLPVTNITKGHQNSDRCKHKSAERGALLSPLYTITSSFIILGT